MCAAPVATHPTFFRQLEEEKLEEKSEASRSGGLRAVLEM